MNSGTAGLSREIACDEFLARHSEYVDGQLPSAAAARLSSHMGACTSCARYDRIVRKGTGMVRALPDVQPSDDFELRLQHRIFHVQDAAAFTRPRAAGTVAALGVAAAIALLAWSPLLLTSTGGTASTAPGTSFEPVYAAGESPLFDGSPWYPVTMPTTRTHPSATLLAMFPGPYSPLIVTPPAHRSVRSVSAGYAPVD